MTRTCTFRPLRLPIRAILVQGLMLLSCAAAAQQAPGIAWQRCYGGSAAEETLAIAEAVDGGYWVAGRTASNNGDVTGFLGDVDAWVLRIAADGTILWQRCLGGSGYDATASIVVTADGGAVVAGMSTSNNGDVTGNQGGLDVWLLRLDALGNVEWSRTYGGSELEEPRKIKPTPDGGFIVSGLTYSADGDVTLNQGMMDAWVLKVDASGGLEWQRTYGGSWLDVFNDVLPTADGGYILAGATSSNNGDVSGNHGLWDVWVVKVDATGTVQWQRAFGGTEWENGWAIVACADGGYALAADTDSNNGNVSGNHGQMDGWLLRLDDTGTLLWQRCFGGTGAEIFNAIQQTADGGFVLGGLAGSNNGDVTGYQGAGDLWLVRVDVLGNILWNRAYGGSQQEGGMAIIPDTGDGYVMAGYTFSNNGDVSGNHGNSDIWVVKLNAVETGITEWGPPVEASLYPSITDDLITLRVTLHASATVQAELHSISGQRVIPVADHTLPVGTHELGWSMRDWPAGIYLVRVRVDGHVRTFRMIRQ